MIPEEDVKMALDMWKGIRDGPATNHPLWYIHGLIRAFEFVLEIEREED